jgi:hypothetical protein
LWVSSWRDRCFVRAGKTTKYGNFIQLFLSSCSKTNSFNTKRLFMSSHSVSLPYSPFFYKKKKPMVYFISTSTGTFIFRTKCLESSKRSAPWWLHFKKHPGDDRAYNTFDVTHWETSNQKLTFFLYYSLPSISLSLNNMYYDIIVLDQHIDETYSITDYSRLFYYFFFLPTIIHRTMVSTINIIICMSCFFIQHPSTQKVMVMILF